MADFGVTTTGFVRKRLADIRTEIIAALRNNLQAAGLSGDIETRPDSVMGILIDTVSEREAAIWEVCEGLYSAMYPSTASGVALDNAVSFTGVTRSGPTKSRGYVLLYGVAGTVIPEGARIRNTETLEVWELVSQSSITTTAVGEVVVAVSTVISPGDQYIVRIDDAIYTWTVPSAGATAVQVMEGLAGAVSNASVVVAVTGDQLRITKSPGAAFVFSSSQNLKMTLLGSPSIAQTVTPSTLGASVGTLTDIMDPVIGWTSVTNNIAAVAGAAAESDSSLRNRYATGMYALGGATLKAIAATITDKVQGVETVIGYENTSDYADLFGRPPHSVHMIVDGGLDHEVARAIYESKAAGIDTFGDTTVAVANNIGVPTLISFDRPVPIYVWIRAVVSLLDASEQAFPDNGLNDIRDALVARGNELGIGDDVIWQSFFRAVYNVSGVGYATLLFATSSDPEVQPPSTDYRSANIEIGARQRATFDARRVEVSSGS